MKASILKGLLLNPDLSVPIDQDKDIAGIKRKPKYIVIYEVLDGDEIDKYILPIYGKGLWSTLYGFIALDKDLHTIKGLTFYEHGETPGLGGEVDNPRWKEEICGKENKPLMRNGNIAIEVIKGVVISQVPRQNTKLMVYQDSTITTRGVDHLSRILVGRTGL